MSIPKPDSLATRTDGPPIRAGADHLLGLATAAGALITLLVLVGVFVAMLIGSAPAWPDSVQALTSTSWSPGHDQYGMVAMLAASLAAATLALVLAAPLSAILAAWLDLYAPPALASVFRGLLDLLAGIPSVVYGLFGLLLVVPLINQLVPPGTSLLAAALVLALMILPYGALIMDGLLRQIAEDQRRAARALAISPWSQFRYLYWPIIRHGAVRAMVLQFGRALGETMAVLMVAGNVVQLPDSPFAPVRTLTANIALEMGYAGSSHRAALYLGALLLLIITLILMLRPPGGRSP